MRASDVLTFLSFFMRLNILPIRIKQTLFFPSYFGLVVLKLSRSEFLAKTFDGSNNCLARYVPQLFFNMYERLKAVVHLKFGGQMKKKTYTFSKVGNRRIFVYTFYFINICLSLSDDANKIKTLNIERA